MLGGVHDDGVVLERLGKRVIVLPKVIDPYRCVDEQHEKNSGCHGLTAATWRCFQVGLCSTEPREPAGAFASDEGSKRFLDQRPAFFNLSQRRGLLKRVVVNRDSRAHGVRHSAYWSSKIASNDAIFDAGKIDAHSSSSVASFGARPFVSASIMMIIPASITAVMPLDPGPLRG